MFGRPAESKYSDGANPVNFAPSPATYPSGAVATFWCVQVPFEFRVL